MYLGRTEIIRTITIAKCIDMETKDSTIKVCEGLFSTSIYEMDVWTLPTDNEDSEEDYMWQLENEGHMDCGLRRELTGLFRTKEWALEDLDKALNNRDGNRNIYCTFIRERTLNCMMLPGEYLKEWIYKYCYLHDESIVRNFAERENPFMGRPQEMIHFKRGDIVMIPDDYAGHWGIVWGTPMTPEQYEKMNERINQGHDGDTMARMWRLDWSDDNYTILINADGDHEHILAHHVLPHDGRIPNFVRKTLMEGLRRAEED